MNSLGVNAPPWAVEVWDEVRRHPLREQQAWLQIMLDRVASEYTKNEGASGR